jgi:predicted glycosyl hydrolase (DUF1957 family)
MDESSALIQPLANEYARNMIGDHGKQTQRIPLDIQSQLLLMEELGKVARDSPLQRKISQTAFSPDAPQNIATHKSLGFRLAN